MFSPIDLIWPIGICVAVMIICAIAIFKECKRDILRWPVISICIALPALLDMGGCYYYYLKWKNQPYKDCYVSKYSDVTQLNVKATTKTPKGIDVDNTDKQVFDLTVLDKRIDSIEQCFKEVQKSLPVVTDSDLKSWGCLGQEIQQDVTIKRNCIIVKIVKPVVSNCTKDWQFIGVKAPDKGCLAKGLTPTKECPCQWRSAIQGGNVLITPPALYLWDLGRMVLNCSNLWQSPFGKCLTL